MKRDAPNIPDQAIDWHLRQAAMTDADWMAFVDWLEADPAHADAYDAVAGQDRLVAQAAFPDVRVEAHGHAANDTGPAPRRWWALAGGGALAAALAAWGMPLLLGGPAAPQTFATRDGERRDLRLPDGTTIAMNGGTTVRIAADGGRSAELVRGEATLHVVHDPARPFTLRAGDSTIRDLGTTFDVQRAPDRLYVAVAEGSVEVAGARLGAGDAWTRTGGRIVRTSVVPTTVGGWRSGLLSFDGTPVGEVAASLRRLHGVDLTVERGLSERPFTGMVHVTGTADRDVPHLAGLIGATWRRDGERWVLAEGPGTIR